MLSVYVVWWIFLQFFQTYFCIQANSVQERQLYFFIMYLSPLMSDVYILVNLFEKPVHNAI